MPGVGLIFGGPSLAMDYRQKIGRGAEALRDRVSGIVKQTTCADILDQ